MLLSFYCGCNTGDSGGCNTGGCNIGGDFGIGDGDSGLIGGLFVCIGDSGHKNNVRFDCVGFIGDSVGDGKLVCVCKLLC